ncbi:hypothetical protein GQ54DRAFT_45880 [Martensiomyces pterosporus]|nr:hypothetical protein GQ54DRAFT_45880 [Martensiomyces pterosporus]
MYDCAALNTHGVVLIKDTAQRRVAELTPRQLKHFTHLLPRTPPWYALTQCHLPIDPRPVSCVLYLIPCVLCLVSCTLYPVSCVLCLVSCVLCLVSCVCRREDKLTVQDLTLDWRKLYELVKRLTFPKVWHDNPLQRRFFPPSAAIDVLQELLPQIQFNSLDWQIVVVQMLTLFLPTTYISVSPAEIGPEQWLPTIFSLWSFNLRAAGYDAYFMNLISCLAVEQKGRLRFTNEQVRFAFASGLHFFNLPVARGTAPLPRGVSSVLTDTSLFYRLPQNGSLPLSEERAHAFAKFIVHTMHDESEGGALEQFEQLVQMIEPFYHPSNNGSWSGILSRFLRHLSKELLLRVRAEAADTCTVPPPMRLTRKMRRRFVVSARTLAMLLLFSKSEDAVSMSHSTLKHLAEVEPDLIFTPLLDTLYSSVDSVTETHRMISAMRALAKLASTLSNFALYPEGAQHVAPLLILTLPGIDVNDTTKTWFALTFIGNLCISGVVFEELPTSGDLPVAHSSKSSSAADLSLEAVPAVDMDQVEWLTRSSTAQFETWIDQYLRRVFSLVDNLSSSLDSSDAASSDIGLQMMVSHTTEMVLLQCSERYYPMISRLITNFASNITSLSAVDSVSKIVYAFANAMPEVALRSLLPMCCERIAEEISNGVGSTPSLSMRTRSHSETTLIWFSSMLATLAECQSGAYLLPYRKQIKSTISLILDSCLSRQVYSIGSKILGNAIARLVNVYPERGRSVPDSVWSSADFHENHFRYWGQHAAVSDESFVLKWHTASADEVEFALDLIRDILVPKVDGLNSLIDSISGEQGSTDHGNVCLNKLLTILRYGLKCLGSLIPPPNEHRGENDAAQEIVEGDDASNMPPRYRLSGQVSAGYVFTDPDDAQFKEIADIRESIGRATTKALGYMAASSEDDVENIKGLVRLAQIFVCEHGADRSVYSSLRRAWSFGMDSFSIDNKQCVVPRYFAAKRSILTQAARLLHNTRFKGASELHTQITTLVAHFCLSPYDEIRNNAASALDAIASIIPALKYPLIPRFLSELANNDASDSDKMIGALHVLDTSPIRRACLRNWHYFPMLVLALCRAQHEDKPLVKKLIRNIAVSHVVHVSAPLPRHQPLQPIKELVLELDAEADLAAEVENASLRLAEYHAFSVAEHAKLVNSLVDILRDTGTTWRFAAISGYFLDQLPSINIPLEQRLVSTLADNLASELMLVRESAVMSLSQLLGKIRRRSKVCSPGTGVSSRRTTISLGDGAASMLIAKSYATLCERALAGDAAALSAPFVDSPAAGWFAWPQSVKTYPAPPEGDCKALSTIDPDSMPAYQAVRDVLFADGKWDRIAVLSSQESMRSPEDDNFGISRATLYSQIFSLFDIQMLEVAWPSIARLAQDTERAAAQRTASEMIAGLLRGSKHWSKGALERMWGLLIPLLNSLLSRLRPDSLRFWQTCLQFSFARRDPRRFLPLIRLLVYGNAFDPMAEAPFAEAAKLELLRVLVSSWDWRIASAIVASSPRLMDALAHPYKQVRDAAGVLMYMLSSSEYSVSFDCVGQAVRSLADCGPTGRDYSHWKGTPRTQAMIAAMTCKITEWKSEHKPSNEGTSNYSRGSKTLLNFLLAGFGYSSKRLAIEYIPDALPLLSSLQEQHDDEDVSRLAKVILQFFSQVLYTAHMSKDVASKILALLEDTPNGWHVIAKTLPLLCTLTFANRFSLSRDMRAHVMDVTASFLVHDQIEVRQTAAKSLTSLIKCASGNVIADLNSLFSQKLAQRLPRIRYGKPPKNAAAYNRIVLARHAGVLGLSCLVLAFPYTIPEWLPDILVLLAQCIDDPNPIQSTVQRTFAEFRRTHMDTWHEDHKKFTSNQLELLTDMLVSPCYYA